MKKNKLVYVLGALLSMGVVSCDLTEKPTSFYEMDTYFTTADKAKMAVIGIYDCLAAEGSYGQYVMPFASSDDMYMVRGTATGDGTRRDISHYALTSSNTWVASVWNYIYEGIDRANTAIAGIEKMPGYENSDELKELVAQARFLRAFLAFDLVRYWGDVPFKTTSTGSFGDTAQPRTEREKIYDQIIIDLDFAKIHLKPGNEVASSEVPCRGAARALLMRVYLQRAGYSLDRTTRTLTRPDDATRKNYFDAVIEEWKAFGTEGYHNFYGAGYEELFKNYSKLVLNNQESLWEIAFEPNNGQKDNAGYWATYNGPLVDAPDAGSGAANQNFFGRANAFFIVLPYWGDFYDDNDVRRDVNFVDYVYRWVKKDKAQVKMSVCQEISKNMYRYPGKWRREWMALGFVDPNHTGVNYCPLRYADVVLMAAEAYNEINDTPKAWELLNDVRARAHATEINSSNYASLMKAPKVYDLPFISDGDEAGKFRTALYWERAFETAYEGQRKFDLIRWGVLGDALRAAQTYIEGWEEGANLFKDVDKNGKPTKLEEGESPAVWDPVVWATQNYVAGHNFVDGKHELLPIPLAEIQSNAQLNGENNPGYE
ncbi:RagB/SusD family nutrient uptake outer membrane protein [Bacteroides stercoris]|uniref:RagB/SusD family nutrient uptake outer membrane protein n=1 Tax=Bacteroides stercoris TaxID=46506 RepID=A0A415PZ58_BACSE|nr:RagB/SusD family nutrient uptake outer membrane protein [Bacteroides stercoris]RHL63280.1 RagB/SusD family nutrient uptake outer membrane protein [Bacteroides stercoris]RHM22079.1 RagB/SusD family nutrient uptake outer membrane protein [Bacteroides stercoris]RHM23970.1 RagB/SusD family nutrient uptake outer membrane protein [Bacteroides stercoris]